MRLAKIVMRNKTVIPGRLALTSPVVRIIVEGRFEGG